MRLVLTVFCAALLAASGGYSQDIGSASDGIPGWAEAQ